MARVLVADDESGIRTFIAETLRSEGLDVTLANDGAEAARLLDDSIFDVLVTDLRMPGLDGLTLVRKVRRDRPLMEVLVLTAHGTVATAVDAMKLGAFDFLTKPLSHPDELRRAVARALHARRGRETASDRRVTPAPGPLVPGPFGTRYEIIRLLGTGGMGAVYQAWDHELAVTVALKVIRPEVVSGPAAVREMERRFKRELLLARQVTHRNVVRIHDLGEIDGVKYITMPYIHGEDLNTRLLREGRLPLSVALGIARDVAAGLAAAHDAGVVHQDLKPANIMLDEDGRALIMDFGIAQSVTGRPEGLPYDRKTSTAASSDARTIAATAGTGVTVGQRTVAGTPAYMAPEQARGERVDRRADIYAFGLILSEAIIGRRRASDSLREVDPSVPASVEAIVIRCLHEDPADRFQTADELVVALDRGSAEVTHA